ncbi:2-phospho-L-lactate transferase [Aeromicrobium sp. PE09-221]|uniref:2-phospho-L-lactate transferase n=1 Tax=Aeromicrobium sp. PE09-221 TaxID=1898043 RepID=UPI000B3E4803|nr:2-phospho-L-lactate transferase [Aeromicrobium sp. PE09-221]OUZ10108.1 2-phospho-L-lactate transferase [Aeromicrobium sp. PE09-221]
MQNIVVLTGGIGGARFLEGIRAARPDADITAVVNTADDLWIFGVRVCPDLDSVMYTLGGGIDPERRWGRQDETWNVRQELEYYGEAESWFGLGDRDLGTHLVRSSRLRSGLTLSQVTEGLCDRWRPGVRLVPMTDDEVATRLVVETPEGERDVHFQEYWIRYRAQVPIRSLRYEGIEAAVPAPGVIEAVEDADAIVIAPSNPIVSIAPILRVPGVRELLRRAPAPVVGVSPIIDGGHVRGMADQLLGGLGLEVSAAGVAEFHGARLHTGVLDGWLVDTIDAGDVPRIESAGITARAVPLYMSDDDRTCTLAEDALELARSLAKER